MAARKLHRECQRRNQSEQNESGVMPGMALRLVVIGAVAAGTKAASRAKRLAPDLDVTIITKEAEVSYAGCGLPYYVGGVVETRAELVVRSPQEFEESQGIRVLTLTEATAIDTAARTVGVKDMRTGAASSISYDRLIVATGAVSTKPRLPGIDLRGVVQLHSLKDADSMRSWVDAGAKHAVVAGGGLIGLEAAENLKRRGLQVTVLERERTILVMFDEEVSLWAQNYLVERGMDVRTQTALQAIEGETGVCRVVTDSGPIAADLVVWATGVHPNVSLAESAGLAIGTRGGISADRQMRTSAPDVWAAGDCTETFLGVTGDPAWVAMGSVANKTGRVAGTNAAATGLVEEFGGVQGTCILKVLDASFGKTGLTERDAQALGLQYVSVLVPSNDKAHYYPGHLAVFIKLVVELPSRRIVGAQVWGPGVVDKPLDVLATAIGLGATVDQVAGLDLAYAPPFSMAIGSVLLACNVVKNRLDGLAGGIGAPALQKLLADESVTVLDVRTEPEHVIRAIPGSVNIPFEELADRHGEIPSDRPVVTVCRVGRRAYLAALALRSYGFSDVSILDGGTDAYPYPMV